MHTSTYRDSQDVEIPEDSSLFRKINLINNIMTVEIKVNKNRISYIEDRGDFFELEFLSELSDVTRPLPLYYYDVSKYHIFGKNKFISAMNRRLYENGITSEMQIFREI